MFDGGGWDLVETNVDCGFGGNKWAWGGLADGQIHAS